MAPLSKDWSASRFFEEVASDLKVESNHDIYGQRIGLVNRAVSSLIDQLYPVMASAYLKTETITVSAAGNNSSAGTGTWTAATRRLVFVGMTSNFVLADVGKLVTFLIGASTYLAFIESFVDGDTVILHGRSEER